MTSTLKPRLDASPIGFTCMGMATILFSMSATEWAPREFCSAILISGGIGLVLTAILEFFSNHTYFMTVFGSYGFFWLAVGVRYIPVYGTDRHKIPDPIFPVMFATWCVFSFILTAASYPVSSSMVLLLSSITLWFLLLALMQLSQAFVIPAGIVGCVAGLLFLYRGYGGILAQVYQRPVLPLLGRSLWAERNGGRSAIDALEARKSKPRAHLP